MRSVEEIKSDIDLIAEISAAFDETASMFKKGSRDEISKAVGIIAEKCGSTLETADTVIYWRLLGMESIFIQDADSLVMKTPELVELISYARAKFPSVKRVTTYARSKSLSVKPLDDLKKIREAGLNRIHIGLESGSDESLKLIRKGVTKEEQINAGRKVVEAGFELSEYYMPGAGGRALLERNAIETAEVITAINPHFVRIRSVVPLPGTPLHEMMLSGEWEYPSEDEKVKEIRLFVECLGEVTSTIESDHIMNLIEDIRGTMPGDRSQILSLIDSYLSSPEGHRESFIVARRLGMAENFRGFKSNAEIDKIKIQLKHQYGSTDNAVLELLRRYI